MKKAFIAAILCAFSLQAGAASTPSEAMSERNSSLSSNYATLGVVFSDIFQKSAGFMSGAHGFSPPMARKKFGFNIGFLAGATSTQIDKSSAAKNLNSNQVGDFLKQLPDSIPVPQGGLNAHLGVPSFFIFESFDAGLRYHGISASSSEFELDLSNIGVDLKGNVFEAGLVSPLTLTLGLSADFYRGKLAFLRSDTLNDSTSVSGYTATGTIQNGTEIDMNNQAYAIKAIVSRKLLFFNPYLGIAAQINNGSAKARGFQKGTVTISGPGGPDAVSSAMVEGSATAPIGGMDMRAGGGFELSFPFFYMSFNGEYGLISKGAGGTFQIGTQFR